jgi:hypothetical protein
MLYVIATIGTLFCIVMVIVFYAKVYYCIIEYYALLLKIDDGLFNKRIQ